MSLSFERMLIHARREQADIARFAARRERFLDALDWDAMPDSFAFETSMDDEAVDHDLRVAKLHVARLEQHIRWMQCASRCRQRPPLTIPM